MENTEPRVFRVHWLVYVRPVLLISLRLIVSVLLIYFAFTIRSDLGREAVAAFFTEQGDYEVAARRMQLVINILYGIGFIVLVSSTVRAVIYLLELRAIRVSVYHDRVIYEGGIFPWDKFFYRWFHDQIYESTFNYASKYIGWVLKYGTVHIIGREGSTRKTSIHNIANVGNLSYMINDLARNH